MLSRTYRGSPGRDGKRDPPAGSLVPVGSFDTPDGLVPGGLQLKDSRGGLHAIEHQMTAAELDRYDRQERPIETPDVLASFFKVFKS